MRLRDLGQATATGLAARSVPVFSSLFSSWALANGGGLSLLGHYAFAVLTMQVVCGNVTLGTDGTLFRMLIRRPSKRSPGQDRALIAASFSTAWLAALVASIGALVTAAGLLVASSELLGVFFLQLALMPLGFASVRTSVAALRAAGRITAAQLIEGVIPALATLSATLIAVVLWTDWLIYIPAATTAGWMANALVARYFVTRQYGKLGRRPYSLRAKIRLIKISIPQQLVNAVNYICDWMPVVVVALLMTSQEMGVFRIITQMGLPLQMLMMTVEFPTSTAIAKHLRAGDYRVGKNVLAVARGAMLLSAIVLAAAIGVLSPFILATVFAVEGATPVWSVGILLAGYVLTAAAGPVASTLASVGSSHLLLNSSLCALLLSLVLISVLGAAFGLIGVCAGVSLAWIARAALNRMFLVRILRT